MIQAHCNLVGFLTGVENMGGGSSKFDGGGRLFKI